MRLSLAITLIAAGLVAPAGSGCAGASFWTNCEIQNSGTQLDIGGSYTQPGTGGGTGGIAPSGEAEAAPPPREMGYPRCAPDNPVCVRVYRDPVTAADEPPEETDAIPAVTVADLASFAPAAPALTSEPGAAGIVGMPTNFVATANEQTIAGTLFGRPVTARFTPVAYVFDYGDGDSTRTATGGSSWGALGQAQFTATATAHAYAARGGYTSAVTVEYAPSVDFGTGFLPVAGVVTATTGGYAVEIYEVRTALVERTCVENPAGPGC